MRDSRPERLIECCRPVLGGTLDQQVIRESVNQRQGLPATCAWKCGSGDVMAGGAPVRVGPRPLGRLPQLTVFEPWHPRRWGRNWLQVTIFAVVAMLRITSAWWFVPTRRGHRALETRRPGVLSIARAAGWCVPPQLGRGLGLSMVVHGPLLLPPLISPRGEDRDLAGSPTSKWSVSRTVRFPDHVTEGTGPGRLPRRRPLRSGRALRECILRLSWYSDGRNLERIGEKREGQDRQQRLQVRQRLELLDEEGERRRWAREAFRGAQEGANLRRDRARADSTGGHR